MGSQRVGHDWVIELNWTEILFHIKCKHKLEMDCSSVTASLVSRPENVWKDICMYVLAAQSCSILCNPMDCGLAGFSVHGILQARILEWVVIPFSRGSFLLQRINLGLLCCTWILYCLSHQGSFTGFSLFHDCTHSRHLTLHGNLWMVCSLTPEND